MSEEKTFWNGEPAQCRRVIVVVDKAPPTWWCAELEGQQREAVEVKCGPATFYLDNQDGEGWHKVTRGRGGPHMPHKSVPVASVVGLAA